MYETQDNTERALTLVTPRVQLDKQKLAVIRATIAPDLDNNELAFFGHVCQRMQLDPFARQIYAVKRGSKLTIQVGIDGFRALAERTKLYRGQIGPEWCGPDGVWVDVWLSDEAPTAAKVGVLRADFSQPVYAVARTKAYRVDNNGLWRTMPDVMIAKCAEALALRKAFPDALGGAYEPGEMEQAGNTPPAQVDIVDEAEYTAARVADETPVHAPAPAPTQAAPAQVTPDEPETENATPVPTSQWEALKQSMRDDLGLMTVAQAKAFMRASLKRDLAGAIPTQHEYDTLCASVKRAVAQKHAATRKLAHTASRPEPEPEPAPDELAAAQADYDASQADQDFPTPDNDYDLSKLPMGAMPS